MKETILRYFADEFYKPIKFSGSGHSVQKESVTSLIDFKHLIEQNPAIWFTQKSSSIQRVKKKIIISCDMARQIKFDSDHTQEMIDFFHDLAKTGFEILMMKNENLEPLKIPNQSSSFLFYENLHNFDDNYNLSKIWTKQYIENQLNLQGEDKDDYCIVDESLWVSIKKLTCRRYWDYEIHLGSKRDEVWVSEDFNADTFIHNHIDVESIKDLLILDHASQPSTAYNIRQLIKNLLSFSHLKKLGLDLDADEVREDTFDFFDTEILVLDLSGFPCLEHVNINKIIIDRIIALPLSIKKLTMDVVIEELPDFSLYPCLQDLTIRSPSLSRWGALPPNLKTLTLRDADVIPDLSGCEQLETLVIIKSNALNTLDLVPSGIKILHIENCANLQRSIDFSRFTQLKELAINDNIECSGLPTGLKPSLIPPTMNEESDEETDERSDEDKEISSPPKLKTFDISSNMDIDTKTYTPPDTKLEITVSMWEITSDDKHQPINSAQIRGKVIQNNSDLVTLENPYITPPIQRLGQIFQAADLKELKPGDGLCEFKLNKSQGWQALPMRTAHDFISKLYGPPGSEIRYNLHLNQYEIRWRGQGMRSPAKIQYSLRMNISSQLNPSSIDSALHLSKIQRENIRTLLSTHYTSPLIHPKFHALQQSLIHLGSTPAQHAIVAFCITDLRIYCLQFNSQPLSDESEIFPPFIRILLEGKGSCRHRTHVFCLIARYLKLPTRIVNNEIHSFVEILIGNVWIPVDLSGSPVKQIHNNPSVFTLSEPPPPPKPVPPLPFQAWRRYFVSDAAQSPTPSNLAAVLDDLKKSPNSLLKVNNAKEARDLYVAMTNHLHEQKESDEKIFYAESLTELLTGWTMHPLDESEQSLPIPGPLQQLNKTGGTVIIYWERFSETAMAACKSFFDTPPSFAGQLLNPELKIINLVPPTLTGCPAFYSRVSPFNWPESIPKPARPSAGCFPVEREDTADEKELPDAVQIDLYGNQVSWHAALIGDIGLGTEKSQPYIFRPGALIAALENKKTSMEFIDAPWDSADFCSFMTRLMTEKTFWANGKFYQLPDNFTFYQKKAPLTQQPGEIITRSPDTLDEKEQDPEIFYLHNENLSFLRQQQHVDSFKKLHLLPGWLAQSALGKKIPRIVQTGSLTSGQLRQVYDEIKKVRAQHKDFTVQWVDLTQEDATPPPVIEQKPLIAKDVSELLPAAWLQNKPGAYLLEVADPHFVAASLTSIDHAQEIHEKTTSADILEIVELSDEIETKQIGKKEVPLFSVQLQRVITALRCGKTVVLHGQLSPDLYRALEPLFSNNPQLKLTEDKNPQPITGKLLVVSQKVNFSTYLARQQGRQSDHTQTGLLNLYYERLKEEKIPFAYEDMIKVMQFIHKVSAVAHGGVGTPPEPRFNYILMRQFLKTIHRLNKDNPCKAFFPNDYDPDSEIYAYINIIAKLIFSKKIQSPGVRKIKLKEYDSSSEKIWQRLNCLNASALRKIITMDKLDFNNPPLNREPLAALTASLENIPSHPDPQKKIAQEMAYHLRESHAVVLKGPPGSGKTFSALNYCEAPGRTGIWGESDEQIIQWLKSECKSGEESILIVDEANLKSPGHWEFLRPLIAPKEWKEKISPIIRYKNSVYHLSPGHKVIFTCNPEHYQGRSYHSLLRDTPTIDVKKWTNDGLLKYILNPLFLKIFNKEADLDSKKIMADLINTFRWVEKNLPSGQVSLRDLKQVAFRWISRLTKEKKSSQKIMYEACEEEWGFRFPREGANEAFRKNLAEQFSQSCEQIYPRIREEKILLDKLPPDYYLTDQLRQVFLIISRDLEIGAHPDPEYTQLVKHGVVLEGESGFGKSELYRQLLFAKGYTHCKNPKELLDEKQHSFRNRFIQFTPGSDVELDKSLLLAAFNKGCVVILDELNLAPELEIFLNHLLTGITPEGKSAKIPGFMLLASQNPRSYAGRKMVSKALTNRCHSIYVKAHSREDLWHIARKALPGYLDSDIDHVVSAYLHEKNLEPKKVTMGSFYRGLKKIKEDPPVLAPSGIRDEAFRISRERTKYLTPVHLSFSSSSIFKLNESTPETCLPNSKGRKRKEMKSETSRPTKIQATQSEPSGVFAS